MNNLFFGSSKFSVIVFEALYSRGFPPKAVITSKEKPRGRGMRLTPTPVMAWALEKKIPVITNLDELRGISFTPDVSIIASYREILPKEIISLPKYGTLNVHPSLLPKFRGPSPIQSIILSGEKETGVTIILTERKVDHGPIIASRKLEIAGLKPTYKELERKLAELGGELISEILPEWIEGKVKPVEQNHKEATYTRMIKKEDGLITWRESPEEIDRKVRAYTPWPSAYFFISRKDNLFPDFRVIITKTRIDNNKLILDTVKPEGESEMTFDRFLKKYPGAMRQIVP